MICLNCNCDFELFRNGRGGHNRTFCYECLPLNKDRNKRNQARYELLAKYSNKIKLSRGCDLCGYDKCAQALEWHHIDPNKDNDPSVAIRYSLNRYLYEIDKCTLLCANCHREEHHL